MSKTARGYRSQRSCESKKHPAILPWPSGLSRDIDGPVPVSNRQNCILPGKWRKRLCAFADTRAEKPARKLKSAANTKPLDQLFVTSFISAPKVVEYLTALRHELQQPAPRVVVLETCVLKCSVRLVIRSDNSATCTSGEPVSPDFTEYDLITSALRAVVIDIVY